MDKEPTTPGKKIAGASLAPELKGRLCPSHGVSVGQHLPAKKEAWPWSPADG